MSSIPASQIDNIVPSVLTAGGDAIDLNGVVLTKNTRVPIGTVMSFGSPTAVASFFGASDPLVTGATVYFNGTTISTKLPGALLVTQYPAALVAAYLRGGNISALPLATLQGFNATLNVTIDAVVKTASINLSAATSFSNAAEMIAQALGIEGVQAATFTGSIAATVLTVASGLTGTVGIGDVLSGTSVTANTYVVAQLTGPAGGLGTYTVSTSQTTSSTTITAFTPAVQFDSVSGAFLILSGTTGATSTITFGTGALATDLLLTQATGAVLSQGAAAAVPAAFMDGVVAATSNWSSFMTAFDPDGGSGNSVKLAFAAWTNGKNNRFWYAAWDTDPLYAAAPPQATTLAQKILAAQYSGTSVIYEPSDLLDAWFAMGWAASMDFTAPNGRQSLAFRSQPGLVAGVTDGQTAINVGGNPQITGDRGNGANFYGNYGSGNANSAYFNRGFVSGPFMWADSFVIQIWLNNLLQVALQAYHQAVGVTPFNPAGYAAIEQALSDPIAQGLSFGAYVPGGILSSSQAAAVNAATGVNAANIIQQRGWYLQITPATPQVRAARGPIRGAFYYFDGQSIQAITLASVAIQ